MTTYTALPTQVDAIRYDAPTEVDGDGNIAEVEQFGNVYLVEQTPWIPEGGQNCVLVFLTEQPTDQPLDATQSIGLLTPGDYLVKDADGAVHVAAAAAFAEIFDVSADAPVESQQIAQSDTGSVPTPPADDPLSL
jgi:hypothetical protein